MTTIVTLKNATKQSLSLIGEKAVNLALLNQNCNVPPAIIISNETFQKYLEQTEIGLRATKLLTFQDTSNIDARAQAANRIKEMIMETQIPEEIFEEIKEAYFALSIEEGKSLNEMMQADSAPVVAIRPSPVGYNGKGLHTSILNIRGQERLQKAILLCWASYYSPSALETRQESNEETKKDSNVGFAVIIQKMIDSQAAGEIHTEYKMNPEEVLILGCKGLGSALSKGLISPDKYFITKSNFSIAAIEVGKQTFMLERDIDNDKTTKIYLQEDYAKKQKIADRHIGELTLLTKKMEEMFGKPQIVDFAIHKDTIYVLGTYEPQWHKEKLQTEIREKREAEEAKARLHEEPKAEVIEEQQEQISYGIVEELDRDELVNAAMNGPKLTEAIGPEPTQHSETISQEPQQQVMPLPQIQEATDMETPKDTNISNEISNGLRSAASKSTEINEKPTTMQEKVAAMTAAVQEIQKPEQKETPILTNLEMMEKREEEVLEKVKEQKGEIDINDLIMSIDPDALEEEMARQTTIEPIQQTSAETPHLEIPQQARSQIITEEVQPESARMEQATQEAPIQHSEARDLINTQNQETQVPEQGSTEPVAPQQPLGTMIITYFKEIKELVPKEEWSAHPDVRHLAVLAQRYVETKIHPTKEQVHYAKEAVGRLKE